VTVAGGPYFDDLAVGAIDDSAPAVTLTDGLAAAHRAIVGDRLALALDAPLARKVTGGDALPAHPALVWDVAIGQSTTVTRRVIANLFYRGLQLRRAPVIGDTLRTATEVVAMRQNTPREGRRATGLAALRIRTVDQEERPVLDFWRCAMLPLHDPAAVTGHADTFDDIPAALERARLTAPIAGWRLDQFDAVAGVRFADVRPGARWTLDGGDVVSGAPELARLTLNVAAVHHDRYAHAAGRRLVYGGHTIGVAAAQASRILPNLVTIVAWHGCDHLAPVYEGDTLRSELEVERVEPLPGAGGLVDLRIHVRAQREDELSDVLDWRFVAAMV
jgi:acyl dehydratase